MAERARSGLGRALVEREDCVLCGHIGHEVGVGLAYRLAVARLQRDAVDLGPRGESGPNLIIRRRQAAVERVLSRSAAAVAREVSAHIGGADSDAGGVRCRRNPLVKASGPAL